MGNSNSDLPFELPTHAKGTTSATQNNNGNDCDTVMDSGGWADIHSIVEVISRRRLGASAIGVNEIVGLVRTSEYTRFEVAILSPKSHQIRASNAALDEVFKKSESELKPLSAYDPRGNKYQTENDRPIFGFYVGIRAVQGHSRQGVLDERIMMPIFDDFRRMSISVAPFDDSIGFISKQ